MAHPALLRPFGAPVFRGGQRSADRFGSGLAAAAKRLLRRLNRTAAAGYRPELHYMRGGRTAGAKSLAAG